MTEHPVPEERLTTQLFTTRSGAEVRVRQLPALVDPQTGETVGYRASVSAQLGHLVREAEAAGQTEIEFVPLPPGQGRAATPNPASAELERALTQRGLTRSELARRLRVQPPLVTRWLSPDYQGHNLETLRRIAEALDMELEIRLKPRAS